jgi:methionyl-tRNA formyltransferase
MRIVFFGSDIFAVPCLEALAVSQFEVAAVVTQPDKKKGRHLALGYSAVKATALNLGLKILQPEKISDQDFIGILKDYQPDLLVVAAYGKILSRAVLEIPRIMPLNIHGSLLPKYRGAAPINWAMINGEKETGITLIRMNEAMDAGDIIVKASIRISEEDTAATLRGRLAILGAEALIQLLKKIEGQEKITFTPQDEKSASLAPKLKKSDGLIDWRKDAKEIYNRIRGLQPWPDSFTYYKGKMIKVLAAEAIEGQPDRGVAGEVVAIAENGIMISTGKGLLRIKEIQLESAKRMPVRQFVLGHRIETGQRFD